jgi:hypothetical protein
VSRFSNALLAAGLGCALLLPSSAGAATVVNGDFETGVLSGWSVYNHFNNGFWTTYSGTGSLRHQEEEKALTEEGTPPAEVGVFPFFAPPQGTFAAVTEQNEPDTDILFQEVTLEPHWTHQLSAYVYYRTEDAIKVPEPNTLMTEAGRRTMGPILTAAPGEPGFENQQMRLDVMRAGSPIESLASGDVLATAFATKPGDPLALAPTQVGVDLTPLAGQTVRIRIAAAINEGPFEAGVDGVTLTSTPPSNEFKIGKFKPNKKKGTGSLTVTVPGPGVLKAVDAAKKGKPKFLKQSSVKAKKAGKVKLVLKPSGLGVKELEQGGSLEEKAKLSFTPTGGSARIKGYTVKLAVK